MAALNFPSSPSVGAVYSANGYTWTWDGTTWLTSGAGTDALRWRSVVQPTNTYRVNDVVRGGRHMYVALANGVGYAANFEQMDQPGRIALSIVSGAVDWNTQLEEAAYLIATQNFTMNMPAPLTSLQAGQTYMLLIQQDTTGGRVITWNSNFKWPGGTPPVLSTAANAIDIFSFIADGTGHLYGVAQKGFA
jgi:hypothetical protein